MPSFQTGVQEFPAISEGFRRSDRTQRVSDQHGALRSTKCLHHDFEHRAMLKETLDVTQQRASDDTRVQLNTKTVNKIFGFNIMICFLRDYIFCVNNLDS